MEDVDLKELIVEHSMKMFVRDGCAHVSMDDIATELGISKKTLYKHFAGKDELVEVVARRMMGDLRTTIESIFRDETRFPEKVDRFMSFVAGKLSVVARPFLADIRRHHPALWKEIESFRRERIFENFQRLLNDGIEQGFVRPDLNPQLFILSFLSAVENVVTPAVLSEQSFSASGAIRGLLRIFFQGIMTSDASREFDALQVHHVSS